MILASRGDLAGARAIVEKPPAAIPVTRFVSYVATYWEMYWLLSEDQQQLLLRLPPSEFDDDRASWGLSIAGVATLRGDARMARAYGDSARHRAARSRSGVRPRTGSSTASTASRSPTRGGRPMPSARASAASRCIPSPRTPSPGPYFQHQLARIYILVGEPEKALDQLEPLLRMPYYLSPAWLRADPTFDPLRNNPRFRKLAEPGS